MGRPALLTDLHLPESLHSLGLCLSMDEISQSLDLSQVQFTIEESTVRHKNEVILKLLWSFYTVLQILQPLHV